MLRGLSSGGVLSYILYLLEPDKIDKINIRQSQYLINIHPSYYGVKDVEEFIGAKQKQKKAVVKKEEDEEEEPVYYSQHKQIPQEEGGETWGEEPAKVEQTVEQKAEQKKVAKPRELKNKAADKTYSQKVSASKNENSEAMEQSKLEARLKRRADIEKLFNEVVELYLESGSLLDLKDLDPFFDDIIHKFMKDDIEVVVKQIAETNYDLAANLIKVSARHSGISGIFLSYFFNLIVNKK